MSVASTEYIRVPIQAWIAGVAVNPTSDTVSIAWVADGTTPVTGDFSAATWETDTTTDPDTYYARRVLAAGALAAGTWIVWIKVVHSPETIVRRVGPIRVV